MLGRVGYGVRRHLKVTANAADLNARTTPPNPPWPPHRVPLQPAPTPNSPAGRTDPGPHGPPLSPSARRALAAWLAVLVLGFGLARWLEPSPAGFGTHRRLGLPPCTVRAVAGIPCPSCGMTTSFANVTRGRFAAAARANSGGLLLAVFCAAQIPWLAASLWTGRPWRLRRPEWWAVFACGVIAAVTLADWAVRLATGRG